MAKKNIDLSLSDGRQYLNVQGDFSLFCTFISSLVRHIKQAEQVRSDVQDVIPPDAQEINETGTNKFEK